MPSSSSRLVARTAPAGSLVLVRLSDLPEPPPGFPDGTELVVCLKAFRRGKGFINHYVVPLDPLAGALESLEMIYIDAESPLLPAAPSFRLTLSSPLGVEGGSGADAICGGVVENTQGRFLKVREPYKGAFSLAYIDLETGEVKRRQQGGQQVAAYTWSLTLNGPDPRLAPAGVLGWVRQIFGRAGGGGPR